MRQYGDGNPGATNALRAGGWRLGLLVLVLDISKGAIPTGLAYQILGIRGVEMWCIALASTLGHAFSPFLGWRGGKALAVTLGVWIGLSLYQVPIPILLFLVFWFLIFSIDGWAVLFTCITTFIYLWFFFPDPLFYSILAGQTILVIWKHRADLVKRPAFRSWLTNRKNK